MEGNRIGIGGIMREEVKGGVGVLGGGKVKWR